MTQAYSPDGLSMDAQVWSQRVDLNMSVFQTMTVQTAMLVALRHPDVQGRDEWRDIVEEMVALLSRTLIDAGAMTEMTLRMGFEVETFNAGMTWHAFQAACARIDARMAAAGHRNQDASEGEG